MSVASSSGRTTIASSGATASFSVAIASTVSPRTSVWSSPTFVRSTTRVAQDVRRVVASAQPRLDDGDVDAARRRTPASAAAVTISNCVASSASAGATHAPRLPRSRPLCRRPGFARSTTRRAARWSSRRRALREQQLLDRDRVAVDLPFVPDDVDRGARGLRFAELRQERAHPLEPEAVARPRAHRIEPLDGGRHSAT